MNPIIIESFFNKEEFMKSREILWKLYSVKSNKNNGILLYLSLAFFGLSILNSMYGSKPSSYLSLIGGTFLFITLFYFLERTIKKRQYLNHNMKIAESYETNVFYIKYEIDEESIKYSDNEKTISLEWDYFSSFTIYQSHLVLVPNFGSYLNSTIFVGNGFDFPKLKDLANLKLKEITIL